MFTWLNKQGVKSTKGFIVQCVSRFIIEYRENEKCISIQIEIDINDREVYIIVSNDSFARWDSGNAISSEKQAEIVQNFKDAMNFQDLIVIIK